MALVTNSPPQNTTRVRATLNTAPETSFAAGSPSARKGPAVETMRTTPTPMNIPASIADTR